MATSAIRAEGLSKRYRIGERRDRYDTFRDQLARLGRPRRRRGGVPEIWALRDVSFEIAPGEVVGLIGRNGAGKTTLLRVLSRITEPTLGAAEIRGRTGTLLEVGTGFHPELTGRENVFLNGAILGMRRQEIAGKFDEIVQFAGVGNFIDTPVKRYSSGMHVRLAFAVAAHLESEVLFVDEVLAVGDAEFQKRSLRKMEEVGRSGRTIVLVSHNMPTISALCDRALLLDGGRLVKDGPTDSVVAAYLRGEGGTSAERTWTDPEATGTRRTHFLAVRVVDEAGTITETVGMDATFAIEAEFEVGAGAAPIVPMIAFFTDAGTHVFNALDPDPRWDRSPAPGRYRSSAHIPRNLLNEGRHIVSVFLNEITSGKLERHAVAQDAVAFQVVARGAPAKGSLTQTWGGAISPLLEWTTESAR